MIKSISPDQKCILITGVSTGIGKSIAEKFLREGHCVFGSVRKEADANELAAGFPDQFQALVFDVTDKEAIANAVKTVEKTLKDKGLDCLINNAGIAKAGPLIYMDDEVIRRHFEVNVFGVINVIKAFSPLLGAKEHYQNPPGKIINISSSSGKIASPFVAPYVGSKHALEGISNSLRRELMKFGIDVVLISPGVVKTPIWDKSGELDEYNNTVYRESIGVFKKLARKRIKDGLEPEFIARKTYKAFVSEKPKTRYAITPNRLTNWILPRMMPARALDKIFAKMQKLNREK